MPNHNPLDKEFIQACQAENFDEELIKKLIKEGANVNAQYQNGPTALHFLCINKNVSFEIVKFFIDNKADPTKVNAWGNLPLHLACLNSDLKDVRIIESLITEMFKSIPNLNIQNNSGDTPLHLACWNSSINIDIIKSLIIYGFNLNIRNNQGSTPLHFASGNQSISLDILKYLIEKKANPHIPDNNNNLPFHFACGNPNSNIEVVEFLFKNSPENIQNLENIQGSTALHFACDNPNPNSEIIQFLIDSKAGLNVRNSRGETPLFAACWNKSSSIQFIKFLFEKGADPTIKDNNNITVAQSACHNPNVNVDLIQYFIKKGVKLDAKTDYGQTIFHFACLEPKLEIFQFLVERLGAEYLKMKSKDGETPWQLICSKARAPIAVIGYLLHQLKSSDDYLDLIKSRAIQGYNFTLMSDIEALKPGWIYLTIEKDEITQYSIFSDLEHKEIRKMAFVKPIKCHANFNLDTENNDEENEKLKLKIVEAIAINRHALRPAANLFEAAEKAGNYGFIMCLMLFGFKIPQEIKASQRLLLCQQKVEPWLKNSKEDKLKICKQFLDNLVNKPHASSDFPISFQFFIKQKKEVTFTSLLCFNRLKTQLPLQYKIPKYIACLILLAIFLEPSQISQNQENLLSSFPSLLKNSK